MKKNIIVATIITSMLLSGTAFAKFSDEYKAKYPKNVTTKTNQLKSGKMYTTTTYNLFKSKKSEPSLGVLDNDGIKTCYISYTYLGRNWRFYDKMSWGDGKEAHDIPLLLNPQRRVAYGSVTETLITLINPADLKKAIVIHAHSENGGDEVIMNEQNKRWKEWQAAVDIALKLTQEK